MPRSVARERAPITSATRMRSIASGASSATSRIYSRRSPAWPQPQCAHRSRGDEVARGRMVRRDLSSAKWISNERLQRPAACRHRATATSGRVGIAAGCVSREQRGAVGAHNSNSSSAGTPQPAAAWRCEPQRDRPGSRSGMWPVGAPVAPSLEGSLSGDFGQDGAPHLTVESPASASLSQAAGPPRSC
jgi:hypothetical protein